MFCARVVVFAFLYITSAFDVFKFNLCVMYGIKFVLSMMFDVNVLLCVLMSCCCYCVMMSDVAFEFVTRDSGVDVVFARLFMYVIFLFLCSIFSVFMFFVLYVNFIGVVLILCCIVCVMFLASTRSTRFVISFARVVVFCVFCVYLNCYVMILCV